MTNAAPVLKLLKGRDKGKGHDDTWDNNREHVLST